MPEHAVVVYCRCGGIPVERQCHRCEGTGKRTKADDWHDEPLCGRCKGDGHLPWCPQCREHKET